MKRLKGFIIFLYIFLTMLVLIIQPAMHKPVSIENVNFKIKEQLMRPKNKKVSDFMVSIRFYRANKTVAQKPDTTIHIKPDDDDKRISFDLTGNADTNESSITFEDNIDNTSKDINIDISREKDLYSERYSDFGDKNTRYSESEFSFGNDNEKYLEQEIGFKNEENINQKNIEYSENDIPTTDKELNAKDEIGSWRFKGSKEEIVAWNVWRSNLQNRIMDESGIEAPVGTLILFSFDVSNTGHITNLRYTCSNKEYTRDARADMVRILRKLEGNPILNFPPNTKRKGVKFKGGFLLDYTTQYSTPEDYSDYERIRL